MGTVPEDSMMFLETLNVSGRSKYKSVEITRKATATAVNTS